MYQEPVHIRFGGEKAIVGSLGMRVGNPYRRKTESNLVSESETGMMSLDDEGRGRPSARWQCQPGGDEKLKMAKGMDYSLRIS